MLRKAFTLEELEVMDAKMEAAINGSVKVIDAPKVSVEHSSPVIEENQHGGGAGDRKVRQRGKPALSLWGPL